MRHLAVLLVTGVLFASPVAFADAEADRSGSAASLPHPIDPTTALFLAAPNRQPWLNFPTLLFYVPVTADEFWLPPVMLSGSDQIDDFTNVIVTLGRNLALDIHGQVELVWAEIAFGDGTTQVLDFQGFKPPSGISRLLGSGDLRVVETVHLKVRGVSPGATIRVGVQP